MAHLLCEQKALICRDQVPRAKEINPSPCGHVHKIEAILSSTLDRGINQLPIVPSAAKARSLRQAPQMGDRVEAI